MIPVHRSARPTLLALLLLAGCASARGNGVPGPGVPRPAVALSCTPPAAPMIRSTLYFGLRRAHGGEVSPDEWEQFLTRDVVPKFGGLTVLDARGVWLGSDGPLVREPSRMVVILHAEGEGPRAAIADVIRLYRERFDQQSVLWETAAACAAF